MVIAMGVTHTEKVELAVYQHKDVAQVWFELWRDGRPFWEIPIDSEVFKVSILD